MTVRPKTRRRPLRSTTAARWRLIWIAISSDSCIGDAVARRLIGRLAIAFLHQRAHRKLGFIRLGDYTRERLGISARELESMAAVARRLEALPAITDAQWVVDAQRRTVRELDALIKEHPAEREAAIDRGLASDDDLIDGEPTLRVRIACPGRVRSLRRYAIKLARRMCGAPVPVWQAAEAIAAEGLAGRLTDDEIDETERGPCSRGPRAERKLASACAALHHASNHNSGSVALKDPDLDDVDPLGTRLA